VSIGRFRYGHIRSTGRRPVRFANYSLLRSFCLWLMGHPPHPKMKIQSLADKSAQPVFFILLLLRIGFTQSAVEKQEVKE